MNKYETALDTVKSAVKEVNPNQGQLRKAYHNIQQLKVACEKAEKYDNALLQYVNTKELAKQDIAKEIIEMLEEEISFCKKEEKLALRQNQELSNEFGSIWCALDTQVDKIKERYGIK